MVELDKDAETTTMPAVAISCVNGHGHPNHLRYFHHLDCPADNFG